MNSKGEEKTENLGQQWSEKSIFFFLKVSADLLLYLRSPTTQIYEIKSPSWTILWFRILGIFSVKNIKRLCVFMFQTSDNSQLCIDSQYSSQQLPIVSSLKHKNTQPLYIFNRENSQNSKPQNGPRRGLDFIALDLCKGHILYCSYTFFIFT